jgi:hypothetical protein
MRTSEGNDSGFVLQDYAAPRYHFAARPQLW